MDLENQGVQPDVVSTESETPNETQENVASTVEAKKVGTETPKSEPVKERVFTQEQLNNIMRTRLERDRLALLGRYGVKDRDGLDSLIGKAQSYEIMRERYDAQKNEIAELKERLAFMSNGINPDREDDIRAYFKGKGLEFNEDALINELETHPEWRKVVEMDETPKTTIKVLGVEHRDRNIPETDAEKQRRIFGI